MSRNVHVNWKILYYTNINNTQLLFVHRGVKEHIKLKNKLKLNISCAFKAKENNNWSDRFANINTGIEVPLSLFNK